MGIGIGPNPLYPIHKNNNNLILKFLQINKFYLKDVFKIIKNYYLIFLMSNTYFYKCIFFMFWFYFLNKYFCYNEVQIIIFSKF